ncbi:hypothetical protein DID88_003485 [Monilinia fructigena]|uniref:Swiss Army Knife protein DSP-PTPase phosphatase domain-containing protein n=1 Tax=Monilinia fructigena TaxID=38457 RepID=A0A395IU96_9HELO|nr:hypothetical protein DID88_003485 [Monilinia fructigena]
MSTIPDIEAKTNKATTSNAEVNAESEAINLTAAKDIKKSGFSQWETVTRYAGSNKLYRSSSPNYDEKKGDKSQYILKADIDFLHKQNIGNIICLNSDTMTSYAIGHELGNAKPKIEFTHIPVEDYHSPTLDRIAEGYKAYTPFKKDTLVWCGFGYGRIGTMITALQYKNEKGKVKLPHTDYYNNYVEPTHQGVSTGQFETLDKLQK